MKRSVPALAEGFTCEGTAAEKTGDPGTAGEPADHGVRLWVMSEKQLQWDCQS